MRNSVLTENQPTLISKASIAILLLLAATSSISNIVTANVPNPIFFIVTITGFVMFVIAKISVIKKGIKVSWGTTHMSQAMANTYRLGYWLMLVGILCTFNL